MRRLLANGFGAVALTTAARLFLLYPDGRVQRRYERWVVGAIWAGAAVSVVALVVLRSVISVDVEYDAVEVDNPLYVSTLAGLRPFTDAVGVVLGGAVPALVVQLWLRYWRSNSQVRQQIRWLLLVPICAGALFLIGFLLDWAGAGWAWFVAGEVGQYLYLGLVPGVLLVSITRHRLLGQRRRWASWSRSSGPCTTT